MLKEANHLDQVVKLKVKGTDVEPLMPYYDVSHPNSLAGSFHLTIFMQNALDKLKDVYGRSNPNSS